MIYTHIYGKIKIAKETVVITCNCSVALAVKVAFLFSLSSLSCLGNLDVKCSIHFPIPDDAHKLTYICSSSFYNLHCVCACVCVYVCVGKRMYMRECVCVSLMCMCV